MLSWVLVLLCYCTCCKLDDKLVSKLLWSVFHWCFCVRWKTLSKTVKRVSVIPTFWMIQSISLIFRFVVVFAPLVVGTEPRVGPGHPLSPSLPRLLVFFTFLFPFLGGFNYFLLLSIPFLSTRIVPLHFQTGGRRMRTNLGLVCCVYFVLPVFLS